MIGLLPLNRVIGSIAIIYAAIVALAVGLTWKLSATPSLYASFKIAFAGGTALNLALLGFIYFFWRHIWRWFPGLNHLLFPDLNGVWSMEIHWFRASAGGGLINAQATIKQDLLRLSMEVHSPGSDSETLIAQPKKDPASGRPILYYVYRVIPKQTHAEAGEAYDGAAILKFRTSPESELEGNYFTSRNTRGYFSLKRTS